MFMLPVAEMRSVNSRPLRSVTVMAMVLPDGLVLSAVMVPSTVRSPSLRRVLQTGEQVISCSFGCRPSDLGRYGASSVPYRQDGLKESCLAVNAGRTVTVGVAATASGVGVTTEVGEQRRTVRAVAVVAAKR